MPEGANRVKQASGRCASVQPLPAKPLTSRYNPLMYSATLHNADISQWQKFQNPQQIIQANQLDEVLPALHAIETAVNQQNLYAVGFISYEASSAFDPALQTYPPTDFPLLWFGLFDSVQTITIPPPSQKGFQLGDWQPSLDWETYQQGIAGIKQQIRAGNSYQVNYTFRYYAPFSGDPYQLFSALQSAQPTQYGAYLNIGDYAICSASPELFFTLDGRQFLSRPMKGTVARGNTPVQDQAQADWLRQSEKNRAENVMIVDMIRNDVGRVAEIGSVQVPALFTIESYPTVWQMTSTVTAQTEVRVSELFQALFPCASITGAPKVRTMEIIRDLEGLPRQIYTGTIGFIAPKRQVQFNVAIRTVLVDLNAGIAEYGVGGGIVWDSTAETEYEECHLKARLLTQLI